jgi:hypothetical protein
MELCTLETQFELWLPYHVCEMRMIIFLGETSNGLGLELPLAYLAAEGEPKYWGGKPTANCN